MQNQIAYAIGWTIGLLVTIWLSLIAGLLFYGLTKWIIKRVLK